jgi:hypothetical protein
MYIGKAVRMQGELMGVVPEMKWEVAEVAELDVDM